MNNEGLRREEHFVNKMLCCVAFHLVLSLSPFVKRVVLTYYYSRMVIYFVCVYESV